MARDLSHLPEDRQREIELAVAILLNEFDDAIKGRQAARGRAARILKIILFGSFARGDWVADPKGGYYSDYDLLVIVNQADLTDVTDYWEVAFNRLDHEFAIKKTLEHPAQVIVHDFDDVNGQLRRGRPFFVDLIRDGITVYETPGYDLNPAHPLSSQAAAQEAEANFENWFPKIGTLLHLSREAVAIQDRNVAAFLLHQAAEAAYNCALLTLTLYSPKTHHLNELRALAEGVAPSLAAAWPRAQRRDRRVFNLIRRAYVEARYSPQYEIDDTEIAWAAGQVEQLGRLVKARCEAQLHTGKAA